MPIEDRTAPLTDEEVLNRRNPGTIFADMHTVQAAQVAAQALEAQQERKEQLVQRSARAISSFYSPEHVAPPRDPATETGEPGGPPVPTTHADRVQDREQRARALAAQAPSPPGQAERAPGTRPLDLSIAGEEKYAFIPGLIMKGRKPTGDTAESRIPPTLLHISRNDPELRRDVEANWHSLHQSGISGTERVVRVGAHVFRNARTHEDVDRYVQDALQRGLTKSPDVLMAAGRLAKTFLDTMPEGVTEIPDDLVKSIASEAALEAYDFGPDGQFRIDTLVDPRTGRRGVDIIGVTQKLTQTWYTALYREQGFNKRQASAQQMQELRMEAERLAGRDVWKALAAARGIPVIDTRPARLEEFQESPFGLAKAFFSGHGHVSAFTPTSTELEREHWGERLLRYGIMDAGAPWLRELRTMKMGLPITDGEKQMVDEITAMRAAQMPDDETARDRVMRDYLHNYYMMDEFRRWIGLPFYMSKLRMSGDDSAAREAAEKAGNHPAAWALSFIPYFFDIDAFLVGTAGTGLVGSRVMRAATIARHAHKYGRAGDAAIAALKGAETEKDIGKIMDDLHQDSPTMHQMAMARVHARTTAELRTRVQAAIEAGVAPHVDEVAVASAKATKPEEIVGEFTKDYEAFVAAQAHVDEIRAHTAKINEQLGTERVILNKAVRAHAALEETSHQMATLIEGAIDGGFAATAKKMVINAKKLALTLSDIKYGALDDAAMAAAKAEVRQLKTEIKVYQNMIRGTGDEGKAFVRNYDRVARRHVANRHTLAKVAAVTKDPKIIEDATEALLGLDARLATARTDVGTLKEKLHARARVLGASHPEWLTKDVTMGLGRSMLGKGGRYHVKQAIEGLDGTLNARHVQELRNSLHLRYFPEEVTKATAAVREGLKVFAARRIPVRYTGLPFIGISRGLPDDEFTALQHTARTVVDEGADGKTLTLRAEDYFKRMVELYGDESMQRALRAAKDRIETGAAARVDHIADLGEKLASGSVGKKAIEAAKAEAKKTGGALTMSEQQAKAAEAGVIRATEIYDNLAEGMTGRAPEAVFRDAMKAASEGRALTLSGPDLASLDLFEETIKREARMLREGEAELREVLTVLQGDHGLPYIKSAGKDATEAERAYHGAMVRIHNFRLKMENLWQAFSPAGVRIGPTNEIYRDVLRVVDNITDRYSDEIIQLVNRAVRKNQDPAKAMIDYLGSVKPIRMTNGRTFLNTLGGTSIYTRARRAILSDPRTFAELTEQEFRAVFSATSDAAVKEASTVNVPLLGLSRIFMRYGDANDAFKAYYATRRLLQQHDNAGDFFAALQKKTAEILPALERRTKMDKRHSRNIAMGTRLFVQGAVQDHAAWMLWRKLNGVIDADTALDMNRLIVRADSGVEAVENPARAYNALLELGMSPLKGTVEQAPRSALARAVRGAASDSRALIETAVMPTKAGADSVFAPHVLQKEIARKMDAVVKELEPFRQGSAAESWGMIRKAWDSLWLMWRKDATTGLLLPNPRYYVFNAVGDWSQTWVELGFMKATKMATHNSITMIPYIGRPIQDLMSKGAARLGDKLGMPSVAESMMNPHVNRIWHAAPDEIIDLAGRKWTLGELRKIMVEEGILDTFIAEELHSVVRKQMGVASMKGGITTPHKMVALGQDAQRQMENFGIAWQQRQRVMLFTQEMARGKTVAEASRSVRNALYDWGHGVSTIEAELLPLVGQIPFYRFMRLYMKQTWGALTEFASKPDFKSIAQTFREGSKYQRLRGQHMLLGRGIPNAWNETVHEGMTEHERKLMAWARANRPEWTRAYPLLGFLPMDPSEVTYAQQMQGLHGVTAKEMEYALLPPMIGVDGVRLAMLPFNAMTSLYLSAVGEHELAANFGTQLVTQPLMGMMYPLIREGLESAAEVYGDAPSSGNARPGEWRIRPEEAIVMGKLPIFSHYVRKDPDDNKYYSTKNAALTLRAFPFLLSRLPTVLKYYAFQNPHYKDMKEEDFGTLPWVQDFTKMIGRFLVNWGGAVRTYQFDPSHVQAERLRTFEHYLERAQEQARRDAQPVDWSINIYPTE